MSLIRSAGAVLLIGMLSLPAWATRMGTSSWATPLNDVRVAASVDADGAKDALIESLVAYREDSFKRDVALLILLARFDMNAARDISRRILAGEFWHTPPRYTDDWLARHAAITLAIGGDPAPLRQRIAKTPPNVEDAWALAMAGDYGSADLLSQTLAKHDSDSVCLAGPYVQPFLAIPGKSGDALFQAVLDEAFASADETAAACAVSALQRDGLTLPRSRLAALGIRITEALTGSSITPMKRAAVLAELWISSIDDVRLKEALIRVAATASDSAVARAATRAAVLNALLAEPTSVRAGFERPNTEDGVQIEAMGHRSMLQFLVEQPYQKNWPMYLESTDDAQWLALLDVLATRASQVVEGEAKLGFMLGHRRFLKSMPARMLTLRELPDEPRLADVFNSLLASADALQVTSIAARFPQRVQATRARAAWNRALQADRLWLRFASLSNAALVCKVVIPVIGRDLLDDVNLRTWIAKTSKACAGCPAISGIVP